MALPTPYYSHAGITIYHGDCRDILPHVTADVVVTDPPYGMNLGKHGGARDTRTRELRRGAYAGYDDTPQNYTDVVVPAVVLALCRVKRGAVFAPAPSSWQLPTPSALGGVYIPAANGHSPWGFQNLAPLLLYGTAPDLHLGARNTVMVARGSADVSMGHPCPKPVEWMTWLVGLTSREGDTILDPFMGSGTTLVAAKQLGRKAIGIEIEEKYCAIAVQRLQQEVLPLESPEPEMVQGNMLGVA
jgi:site-specific DNA-methyltransferase (adenine-specific)